jgi:predicted outer membrane repeat protein
MTVRNCGSIDGSQGGGLYIDGGASITVTDCTFETCNNRLGAVTVVLGFPVFRDVLFSRNIASVGGGAVVLFGGNPRFEGCRFDSNSVTGSVSAGGAVFMAAGVGVFDGSSFTSNSARLGGAVEMNDGSLWCTSCHFELNSGTGSDNGGGAVFMQGGVGVFDGSSFTSNNAAQGGAVNVLGGKLSCTTCHFELNSGAGSGSGGGAVVMQAGVGVFDGSSFTSNSATYGGAVAVSEGSTIPSLNQTSFVNNTASLNGGALFLNLSPQLTWDDACPILQTVAHGSQNYASQSGGFAFFGDVTSNPTECIMQLSITVEDFGSAHYYGGGFATSPARISVLSVQGSPYSSSKVLRVYPNQPISLVASVHDAFRHPCLPSTVSLTPSVKFIGSMQADMENTGKASFTQASTVQLLQGTADQRFNLSIGSHQVSSLVLQMEVIDCPAG